MQIAKLEIRNFRGIRTGHVHLGPFTVLIGANNAGNARRRSAYMSVSMIVR
jgi:predicted ATP-dependent endonuclease of OLD family